MNGLPPSLTIDISIPLSLSLSIFVENCGESHQRKTIPCSEAETRRWRMNSPLPLLPVSLYLPLSPFPSKRASLISAIVDDERVLPFAAALCSSLPCGSSLSSSMAKRDSLPGLYHSSFQVVPCLLRIVPPGHAAAVVYFLGGMVCLDHRISSE
ncbi:hypothetical protein TIFTF001_031773 [Ficus carica]|uniref:Uncharacterized protein n=1 Tax=Ficus carica TaxID=3494 RepID=A0AA88J5W1_FICCA|nr:hypothetical protein TIFTF001_031773 [Ficus carica]